MAAPPGLLRRALLPLVVAALLPLAAPGTAGTAGAAPPDVRSAAQQVADLQARVVAVAAQLSEGAARYEQGEAVLGASIAAQVEAERRAEASADRGAAAQRALRRLVLARYSDPRPEGLTLLVGTATGVTDALATQAVLARVQGAYSADLRAAQADRGRATVDAQAVADRRTETSALARQQERELGALRALADSTAAELEAAGARLRAAQQAERERAAQQAAREQAAAAERARAAARASASAPVPVPPLPAPPAGPPGAPCSVSSTASYANGFVDDAALCPLETAPRHRLQTDAARAFDAMSRAHAADTGEPLCLTDSYRTYASQVRLFREKPGLAAVPGTSNHGRGLAVDMCGGVQTFSGAAHRWMVANAGRFGWVHPAWARQGGSREEPWHWEFGRL